MWNMVVRLQSSFFLGWDKAHLTTNKWIDVVGWMHLKPMLSPVVSSSISDSSSPGKINSSDFDTDTTSGSPRIKAILIRVGQLAATCPYPWPCNIWLWESVVNTLKKTNSHTAFQLVRTMSNLSTSTKDKPRTSWWPSQHITRDKAEAQAPLIQWSRQQAKYYFLMLSQLNTQPCASPRCWPHSRG